MPSVETATPATAAQTSAAGTHFLGYYLGVGSVKVDALFDTANFVTKDGAGNFGANAPFIVTVGGSERSRVTAAGLELTMANSGKLYAEQVGSASVQLRSSATMRYVAGVASGHQFYVDSTSVIQIGPATITPGADNSFPLANASFRFTAVHAVNGTIQTSDAREKTWRGAPTADELAAASRIIGELGFFQWNDAIALKGAEGARLHFGVRAQAAWAIMADEGLIDPIAEGVKPSSRYAFLCYDEWDAVAAVEEERDEEGNIIVEAVEARPAGNRFGLYVDQLAMFLIAAQEARIAALEVA